MARIRTIKPQFWINEELGTIPRDARLLYIGLWNIADDRGVFQWRPGQILIQLFPYDRELSPANIEEWLLKLERINDIVKFEEDGKAFGYIPNFIKHQDIKKPSMWTFSNSTPLVPQQLPTSTPAVPLGKELVVVGKELEGIGKELEVKSSKGQKKGLAATTLKDVFNSFKKETKYGGLDFDNEFAKFTEYYDGKKIKNGKLACHNWLDKAIEYRDRNNGHSKQPIPASGENEIKGVNIVD